MVVKSERRKMERDENQTQRTTRTGGYSQDRQPRDRSREGERGSRASEFLPSPEVLESYNYVVEGSAKMILTMFELEQRHRHEWESMALKVYKYSTILGQLLSFFIAISVFVSAGFIGVYGDTAISAFIWVFGLAIIVMAGLVWAYAKSMGQRPLFARPTMRTHFRPVKTAKPTESGGEEGE